jgi:nucleoid-associated protein YgaU
LALALLALPTLAYAQDDSVTASDQESDGTSVTVDQVVATAPGWMVIHIDENGSPGAVLGQTQVDAGTTDAVVVTLDPPLDAETTLWAMLHVDEGEVGVYEFPGADVPVILNGEVVMQPFTAMVAAAAEDTPEAEATAEMAATPEAEATEEMAATPEAEATAEMAATPEMAATAEVAATPGTLPTTGGVTPVAVNSLLAVGSTLAALAAGLWAIRRRRA